VEGVPVTDYDPFKGRNIIRQPYSVDTLWEVQAAGHSYKCELVIHDIEVGTEARILCDGDLLVSRLFKEGWQAQQWAEEERKYREKGGE
jgi:hypothetical protein